MELKKNTLASLVLIASGLSLSAHAADSFNINVTGVISPAACEANITGGETIDYGTIHASKLSAAAVTVLPAKQTAFSITCDAPAKMGFRTVDNRMASRMTSNETITTDVGVTWSLSYMNGLGVDGQGNAIGGWIADLIDFQSDFSGTPIVLATSNGGASWGTMPKGNMPLYERPGVPDMVYTIGTREPLAPVAYTTFTGTLAVRAVIAPASTLDLSQPVTLDGSVTVEMVYV